MIIQKIIPMTSLEILLLILWKMIESDFFGETDIHNERKN